MRKGIEGVADLTDRWGRVVAAASHPLPAIGSLLGATAAQHGLSMVTRNSRNFAGLGLEVINPWTGSEATNRAQS